VELNREKSVKNEDMGFEMVDGGARGFHKVIKDFI